MAVASSPSPRMTAMGVLTATSSVPSATRILPMVPSSTASTSMVALSVSISAMTSPDFTASPSFFSHLARLPFSIVGERAGIRTSIGMDALYSATATCRTELAQHIGVKLGRIWLGIVGREFRGLVDNAAHLGIDLLQLVLADP